MLNFFRIGQKAIFSENEIFGQNSTVSRPKGNGFWSKIPPILLKIDVYYLCELFLIGWDC